MTKVDENIIRYDLEGLKELKTWLAENEKYEPRIARWAVDREYGHLNAYIAKLVKRYRKEPKSTDALEQYARCQTTVG